MYPRALSTHSLCLRPFTYLESKREVPELMLNLQWESLGYTVMDYKVRDWAKETYERYNNSLNTEKVYVLAERKENNIVGFISFNNIIFISILEDYQGKGYARESLISVCNYARQSLHIANLIIVIPYDNLKLIHIIEKYCNGKVLSKESAAVVYSIG